MGSMLLVRLELLLMSFGLLPKHCRESLVHHRQIRGLIGEGSGHYIRGE